MALRCRHAADGWAVQGVSDRRRLGGQSISL